MLLKEGGIGVMFSGFSQKKKLLDSWTGNDALSHLRVDFEAPRSLDVQVTVFSKGANGHS